MFLLVKIKQYHISLFKFQILFLIFPENEQATGYASPRFLAMFTLFLISARYNNVKNEYFETNMICSLGSFILSLCANHKVLKRLR